MNQERPLGKESSGERIAAPTLRPEDLGFGVLFRILSDAILVVAEATATVVLTNPAAQRLFGLSAEQAIGQPLERFLPGQTLSSLCSVGDPPIEQSALRLDGTTCHVEITVAPLAARQDIYRVVVLRDITERKAAEVKALESEAKLRAIVEQALDGIWIKDLEGRHILINAAGAAITANTVETALGGKDEEYYDPETARRIREIDERVIATGQGETYEITLPTPNGPRTYFSIKYPYVREDGTIQGIVVITRDITERKQLDQALRDQYEQLKELDRLKTDFVNAVSHELRTPLTTIRGYLEFMEDGIGGTLSPDHAEYTGEIGRSAARLLRLVDDLLDFAHIQAGTFQLRRETFDLAEKIHEVVHSLVPQAEKAQASLSVHADGPLRVSGDPQRLGQVLLNLANNALKFTPAGGQVELHGGVVGDRLHLEVRDTGPGIAPEDVPRLFQKFTQLSEGRRKGGNGLGLSISKAIIDAHGGTIGVESQPGQGSTFWISLPAAPDA